MKLSGNGKALAILLIGFVFCDFLISPLVFETRGSAIIGNPSSLQWLLVLFGGLLLNIFALLLVAFRPRIASILAIVGSIAYIAVSLADQAGLVSSLRPPVIGGHRGSRHHSVGGGPLLRFESLLRKRSKQYWTI